MTEKHIIKVTAEIKQVRLLVRFPCKLTFQLKSDHSQNDSRNSYELKKGECTVNQTLEAQTELNFDPLTGLYEDKKVRIYVQMASANGVIPAGNITFNPCNKEPLERVQYTLPLEKCPDRSAQITFYQSFQLLRKKNPDPIYQSQVAITKTRTELKFSNAAQSQIQNQPRKSPINQKSSNSRNIRLTPSNYRETSPRGQRINTTASHVQNYPPPRQYQQYQQYEEYGESQVQEEAVGYKRYSSRYLDPSEKAHYVKEIAKLKGELKSLQGDQRWEQLIRVKEENEALGGELQKMRERVKLLERREREVNLQLKEAREEGDRNKNKYIQAQSLKNEGQVVLAERERTLRQQQSQLKRLEEKIQDLNVQINNQQKRVEFKENSYQEQLRKLNEKYSQSESERQKVTFDYNTLLARLQETEKKHQAAAKDKDRSFAQERNKLNKKIDTLTQTLDRLKEEQTERESQLIDLGAQAKVQAKRDVQRQERVSALQSQLELARQQLRREQDQRKINQKQISEYKIIEQQRNTLRKRNNEQAGQLAKSAQKLDRANSEYSLLDSKARELESTLSQRTREKDTLNLKYNSLKKELESSKKEEQRLNRQYETLSAQSFNANQKLNEFRSKLDAQKNETEEMKGFYEEQLAYLAKGKQYAQHEIEEQRWSLEKAQQQYQQLGQRLRTANNDILTLNQTILISSERAKRAQDQNKQLNATLENLRKEIVDWQQKERSLNEQLRGKGQNAYETTKKLQRVESELFVVREKLRQTETSAEQRRISDEKSLRQKERVLTQRNEQMTGAQLEALSLKEQKASLTQELAIRNNEISYLKDSLQGSKQDVANRDIKLEELRQELKLSNQQNQQLSKDLEETKIALDEERRTASKNRKQTEQYKTATLKALQQLLEQVGKDEEVTSLAKQNLLTFPDQTLSAMQVETFKKRNLILAKYQQAVLDLKQELSLAQKQLSKARKAITQREEEFENLQKGEKEKVRLSATQAETRRQQLQKKIEDLQEQKLALSGQLQKSVNEIKRRDEIAEELRDEVRVAAIEIESLRGELKLAEQKIVGLKSNQIKWKASNESKISELAGQNQSVLQRYKTTISDLQKKSLGDQKTIREKEENIKKLQSKLSETTYEKEKADVRVLQLHEKWILISEEKKQLEKKAKTLQKENKQTILQLANSRETLSNQKAKLEEVQNKLNQAYAIGTEAQVQVQRLKGEIESVRGSVREVQQESKDRAQKLKAAGQRWANEGKQLKEKIISLSSTVELREFHIGQLQGQLAGVRSQLVQLKEQLSKRKAEGIRLADQLQQKKNQQMYSSQNIEILKSQKEFLEQENDRLKERVASLEEEAAQTQLVIQTAELREKEVAKLKEEIEQTRAQKERVVSELRVSVSNNPRGSGMLTSRLGGDENKKRIRQLEQLLEVKHVDLAIERKKMLNEFEREKRTIVNENSELREQVQNMQNQFDFQRAQLNKEIESLNEDITRLSMELAEKNELLMTSEQILEGVKSEQNSAQIQECIFNIKSIFQRSEAAPNHRSEEQYQEENAVALQ